MSARPAGEDAEHRAVSKADWLLIRKSSYRVAAGRSAKRTGQGNGKPIAEEMHLQVEKPMATPVSWLGWLRMAVCDKSG
jgi:hypothetical protein